MENCLKYLLLVTAESLGHARLLMELSIFYCDFGVGEVEEWKHTTVLVPVGQKGRR